MVKLISEINARFKNILKYPVDIMSPSRQFCLYRQRSMLPWEVSELSDPSQLPPPSLFLEKGQKHIPSERVQIGLIAGVRKIFTFVIKNEMQFVYEFEDLIVEIDNPDVDIDILDREEVVTYLQPGEESKFKVSIRPGVRLLGSPGSVHVATVNGGYLGPVT